jgi:hypothetical protein
MINNNNNNNNNNQKDTARFSIMQQHQGQSVKFRKIRGR